MQRKESETVISGLEKELISNNKMLVVCQHKNSKYKKIIINLKSKFLHLSKSFIQLNKNYQVFKKSYQLSVRRQRTLSVELAETNEKYIQAQNTFRFYRDGKGPKAKQKIKSIA